MFVGCNHRGGLNCNGVIIAGPTPTLPPWSEPSVVSPQMYGGYAITETEDYRFRDWVTANITSSLVTTGLVVWADSLAGLQLAIFNGTRSGAWTPSLDWMAAGDHVAPSA